MKLDFRLVEAVAAVADCGGFARAAERLHTTPSALSHAFRQWEEQWGVRFFERRPLRTTAAGERVLRVARRVLPGLVEAERDLRALGSGQAGRLVVALECHSCFRWLMPAMLAFRRAWPQVETDVRLAPAFAPWDALREGLADLVVTGEPGPSAEVFSVRLGVFEQRLIAAADHPLVRRGGAVEAADLAGETLVTYPVDPERLDVFRRFLWPAGVHPERRTAEVTMMIVTLVASGQGVAVLPDWVLDELRREDAGFDLPSWSDLPLAVENASSDPEPSTSLVSPAHPDATRAPDAPGLRSALYLCGRRDERSVPFVDAFLGSAAHAVASMLEST